MSPSTVKRCSSCDRTQFPIPYDEFGVCMTCAGVIVRKMMVLWPCIEHDCDNLGAFHLWCRTHDDEESLN